MKNVLMPMMRINLAFGMVAFLSLVCMGQTPASSDAPASTQKLAAANCCQIQLAQPGEAELSFPACVAPQSQGEEPWPAAAALRLPELPREAEGSSGAEGSQAEASLPDAASSTRIALVNDAPSRADRMPVAVYPIKFPYTAKEKFGLFVRDIYDPFNFMAEGFNALWMQSQGEPHEYGGGGAGYGRRLGAIVGTDIVGEFTGTFLFPSIFHTDPRYFRMARGSLPRRFFYAISRQLIVKNDSGDDTFNTAKLLSGLATTAVSNSYYPRRDHSFPGIVQHTLTNMGFDALNDAFREFWPDIAHGLHIPAFVIRRTADPTFVDPMDPKPMPMTLPEPANQPPADNSNPAPAKPGLPKNLR